MRPARRCSFALAMATIDALAYPNKPARSTSVAKNNAPGQFSTTKVSKGPHWHTPASLRERSLCSLSRVADFWNSPAGSSSRILRLFTVIKRTEEPGSPKTSWPRLRTASKDSLIHGVLTRCLRESESSLSSPRSMLRPNTSPSRPCLARPAVLTTRGAQQGLDHLLPGVGYFDPDGWIFDPTNWHRHESKPSQFARFRGPVGPAQLDPGRYGLRRAHIDRRQPPAHAPRLLLDERVHATPLSGQRLNAANGAISSLSWRALGEGLSLFLSSVLDRLTFNHFMTSSRMSTWRDSSSRLLLSS